MASLTASSATAPVRLSETGINVAKATYTAGGATTSLSDTILFVKVPHGATIIDGYLSGHAGSGAVIFEVGVQGTDNNLGSALTLSATAGKKDFNGGSMPVRVSLSDDAYPQWTYVFATVAGGSVTTTASLQLVVTYVAPGAI